LRWDRGGVVLGSYTVTEALVIAVRNDEWWPGQSTGFHVIWDGSVSSGQNHLLHATLAHGISEVAGRAWRWACAPAEVAGWLGAAIAFAAVVPKEIGDGFQEGFGFSALSTLWTAGGAILPALQNSSWKPARAIVWKANYWPSAEFRNRTGSLPRIENDYAGQRYFLAVNPGLVQDPSGDWLPWFGFAVGHSVTQWVEAEPTNQWYLTLDVNLRGIPVKASWWPQLAAVLDHVHFPLPGLRLQGGTLRFGFY
jgi:hypothetical protein